MRSKTPRPRRKRFLTIHYFLLLALFFVGAYLWRPARAQTTRPTEASNISMVSGESAGHSTFKYFSFLSDPKFSSGERVALFVSAFVALCALAYAGMLVGQVTGADQGTQKMKDIAAAVREGANAYLARQLKIV